MRGSKIAALKWWLDGGGFPAIQGEGRYTMPNPITNESIPDLYIDWDVPAGSSLPLLVFLHGWDSGAGLPGNLDSSAITYLKDNGIGLMSVGMRGRNTNGDYSTDSTTRDNYRDASANEIYDIYDSVNYFIDSIAPSGHINRNKIILYGVSGGGGNVDAMAVKFPDFASLIVSFYGMPKYGTYTGDPNSSLTSWYSDNAGFQGSINTSIGGAPLDAGATDARYLARDHSRAAKNLQTKIWLFHDSGDTTVLDDGNDYWVTQLSAESKTYDYQKSTDGTWAHGNADLLSGKFSGSVMWLSDALSYTKPTLANSGTLDVIGYLITDNWTVKCKKYRKNVSTAVAANARDNEGKAYAATLDYNTNSETFQITPIIPSTADQYFFIYILLGAKTVTGLVSASDVVTFTPKTLSKTPRDLTGYSWNIYHDLSDTDSYVLDDASKISNIFDLTGNENFCWQQTRATRASIVSGSMDNGVMLYKGTSGTLSTNVDSITYSGDFTFAIKIDPDAATVASLNDSLFGRGSGGASQFRLATFSGKVQVNFKTQTSSSLSNATPSNTDVGLQTIVVTRDSSNDIRVVIKNSTSTYDYGVIGNATGDFELRVLGAATATTKQFSGKIYKFAAVAEQISDTDRTDILNNW